MSPADKPEVPQRIPESLTGQRVVVTGATGFLGGHVVRQLLAAGATVIAVVDRARAASRHPSLDTARTVEAPPSLETVWFDEPGQIAAAVRSARPDSIIHLHAVITTSRDPDALEKTLRGNLHPSLALMETCREIGVRRLVLIGSGEEFGPVTGRFDDHSNANPPSPYGASKAAVTCYAKMFWNAFQLPVVVLRPSVVYGPFQAPRMLIPQVMHALANGRSIPVTGGMQTRDFIHVHDVAAGIVRALTVPDIVGRSWNLGTGEVVTVKHCLSRIEAITGVEGLIEYGALPYKSGETFMYEPVVEETFVRFGWQPRIALDEGLAGTWESLGHPARP